MLTRSRAANPAFDITPARLVTAWVTERGVIREMADLNLRSGEAARDLGTNGPHPEPGDFVRMIMPIGLWCDP